MIDDSDIFFDDDEDLPVNKERPHGVRFGEGQPINRRGRPPGSPNRNAITRRVAMSRRSVMINGEVKRMSVLDLVLTAVKKSAAEGNLAAFALMDALINYHAPRAPTQYAVLFLKQKLSGDEWMAVYGYDMSDEEVEDRYPYLVKRRRAVQKHRLQVELMSKSSEEMFQNIAVIVYSNCLKTNSN